MPLTVAHIHVLMLPNCSQIIVPCILKYDTVLYITYLWYNWSVLNINCSTRMCWLLIILELFSQISHVRNIWAKCWLYIIVYDCISAMWTVVYDIVWWQILVWHWCDRYYIACYNKELEVSDMFIDTYQYRTREDEGNIEHKYKSWIRRMFQL